MLHAVRKGLAAGGAEVGPGVGGSPRVTDVVMPLMGGPELVSRLEAMRSRDLCVLFISGYTDRALIHQGHRGENTAFLQKPFTPDVLVKKVREILDQPRQQAA